MNKLRKVFDKGGLIKKLVYPNGSRRYWWAGDEVTFDSYMEKVIDRFVKKPWLPPPLTPLGQPFYVSVDPAAGVPDRFDIGDAVIPEVIIRRAAQRAMGVAIWSTDARNVRGWVYGRDVLGAPVYSGSGGNAEMSIDGGEVLVGLIIGQDTNVLADGSTEHVLRIQTIN
jgi:hypothetical protein